MPFASFLEDIVDRRAENGAQIIFEDQCYHGQFKRGTRRDSADNLRAELAAAARSLGMTVDKLVEFRAWIQRVDKELDERLSREMALVYTVSRERTRVLAVQYISLREAAKVSLHGAARPEDIVFECELLDLDYLYRGLVLRGQYLFVSERAVAEGSRKYTPADLLSGLVHERQAA